MSECSVFEAFSNPECGSQRLAFIGGFTAVMLGFLCCVVASFIVYKRRRAAPWALPVPAGRRGSSKEALEERRGLSATAPSRPEDEAMERMKEEWDPEPPNEADAVPVLLYVYSPTNQTSCQGEYELVPDERPNGQPLWARKSGGRWIYSGIDGRWYVGGFRSRDKNFACASGFIYCHQFHRSMPPDEMSSGWEWGKGKDWHKDPSITVTVMESAEDVKAVKDAAFDKMGPCTWIEAAMPPAILKDSVAAPWTMPLKESNLQAAQCDNGFRCPSDTSTKTTTSTTGASMQLAGSDTSGSFSLPERTFPPVASAPCATSGHSPGLKGRPVDPPESRPLPSKDPQHLLRVCSPNGQASCIGVYELVPGERPNGHALWKQREGDHWLYCGKNGRWCIAGLDVKEEKFSRSAGFISQTQIERDWLPDEFSSPWQRWDGSQFVLDSDITVTMAQPNIGCDGGGASSSAGAQVLEALACPPTASSSSRSRTLEVVLECFQAEDVDVASMSPYQRCISKPITPVTPWRVGPRLQPLFFSDLSPKAWSQDCLFELSWKPPCLYLTRPALGTLFLDGKLVRHPWTPLAHGAELGLCRYEADEPHLRFRVLLEAAPPPQQQRSSGDREGLRKSSSRQADCGEPSVMDLRGCGLSAEGKNVVQASRIQTLRVIV